MAIKLNTGITMGIRITGGWSIYLGSARNKSVGNDVLKMCRVSKPDGPTFEFPAAGLDGKAGRNLIYGPGDVSLFKNIAITERHKFQFRGEVFNFTDHMSAGPAGIVQFGAQVFILRERKRSS